MTNRDKDVQDTADFREALIRWCASQYPRPTAKDMYLVALTMMYLSVEMMVSLSLPKVEIDKVFASCWEE